MADEVKLMKEYLFPILLSALVVPGAGQIYNKEKVKGVLLMVLFFLVILGFMITISVSLAAQLSPDMVVLPKQFRIMVETIIDEKSGFITSLVFDARHLGLRHFGCVSGRAGPGESERRKIPAEQ